MIATAAVLLLLILSIFWYVSTYNSLVSARNATDQAWSNVEVELRRRLDLIDNLVETVKGYARHEQGTLEKVIAARAQAASAHSPTEAGNAEGVLTHALRGLLAVSEAYPDLKADQGFRELQSQLAETENRIAGQRTAYNQIANVFRNLCETLPSAIVAGLHHFDPKPFFDVPDEIAAQVPKVSFS